MPQDSKSIFRSCAAFSLIEVVVALGIFAIAIVGVLGLLSPTTDLVSDTIDSGIASRLADTVNAEVERAGYDTVRGLLLLGSELDDDGRIVANRLLANRAGDVIASQSQLTGNQSLLLQADRFFEVVLVRNEGLSPNTADNDNSAGFLAFSVRVTWPAQVSDGTESGFVEVPRADRSVFTFNAAVRR